MSLSKNQLKLILSLQQKKYRNKYGLFIAEGTKVVNEFLNSTFKLAHLFYAEGVNYQDLELAIQISESELKRISSLKTPNNVLAIFEIPTKSEVVEEGLILGLDDINDPGNLGTIIRLCDWFGVKHLVCSENTVDCYNSKVVQASMGSLTRVNLVYTNLVEFLKNTHLPKYATLLEGENIYKSNLPNQAIIIMGNEANGISKPVLKVLNNAVSIPRFGAIQKTESLNVATATAILLSEFKRLT
jgi:TrmH family RNA methyltransferase